MLNKAPWVTAAVSLALLAATQAGAQTNDVQARGGEALRPSVATGLAAPADFAVTPLQAVTEKPRKHDSPWDGLLIGAALGAAIGFGTYTECTPVPPESLCGGNLTTSRGMETAVAAALFGAVGLTLDVMLDSSRHEQRAPGRPRPGLTVAVSRTGFQAQFGKRF